MINSGGDNRDDSILPFTDDERRMMRGGGYGGAALAEDSDRPTLGQRIAGDVPKPQPAPAQAPTEAAPRPTFQFDPSKPAGCHSSANHASPIGGCAAASRSKQSETS